MTNTFHNSELNDDDYYYEKVTSVFNVLKYSAVIQSCLRFTKWAKQRFLERFSNECQKIKTKLLPITTGTNSAMKQSQFLAIIWNLLKAREKSRVHGAIGFGFASHWLKNWRESFKPITKCHVITFGSHLKTALLKLGKERFAAICSTREQVTLSFSRIRQRNQPRR